MPAPQAAATPSAQPSRLTNCPDCQAADLTVLRIIPGRAGAEYWTMRCTRCGGIHLDIVGATEVTQGSEDLRA
jgi:Zn finger protein HypA/HybF involved in hydrogenase expression